MLFVKLTDHKVPEDGFFPGPSMPSRMPKSNRTGHNLPDKSITEDVRSWFNSMAHAQGWNCAKCGEQIQVEDRYVYFATGRCARCENSGGENIDPHDA